MSLSFAETAEDDCYRVAEELVRQAGSRHIQVSTAESCTAGMVASHIADVAGASEVLLGGAVTYCDDIKHRVLAVPRGTLEEHTAVSAETAVAMAQGSLCLFHSDIAVSVTGYAGPGGGTDSDPVGTVYFGLATSRESRSVRRIFKGDRMAVRRQAALEALELLLDYVTKDGVIA